MSTPETSREIESKFRVDRGFVLPEPATLGVDVDEPQPAVLLSTYYDTADVRLAREGITLRRREGGSDDGWHLKIPVHKAGRGVRDELRLPLAASRAGTAPSELVGLVRAVVRAEGVRPVASLRVERTTWVLRDSDGRPVAELVDDDVAVLDGGATDRRRNHDTDRVTARFRELELELLVDADDKPGTKVAARVTSQLVAAGAVDGPFVSKAVRALGPLAAAPGEVPDPAKVGPNDPARLAIAAHLARHVRALRAEDILLRRDAEDAVHQMRVAARRLRSGLRVFRPLLDRDWADEVRAELGWLAASLGSYRDAEVMLARFERQLDVLEAGGEPMSGARSLLRRRLRRRMSDARREALSVLDSTRYLDLHERLAAAIADPPVNAEAERRCRDVLPPLVQQTWRRLAKDADRLHSHEERGTPVPDEDWHEARITAKKARYAVEATAPVFGAEAAAFAKQLARVTEVLGDHQDAAVAADQLRDFATAPRVSGNVGFQLGRLHEVQRSEVARTRGDFVAVWPDVRRRRWRRWLGA